MDNPLNGTGQSSQKGTFCRVALSVCVHTRLVYNALTVCMRYQARGMSTTHNQLASRPSGRYVVRFTVLLVYRDSSINLVSEEKYQFSDVFCGNHFILQKRGESNCVQSIPNRINHIKTQFISAAPVHLSAFEK